MEKCQVVKTPVIPENVEILEDKSAGGRVRPWALYKMQNCYISKAYENISAKKSERLKNCASLLVFSPTESGKKKLKAANFCRVRLCPVCQWRRSMKNFGQIQQILAAIEGQYEYIFLTLTLKNCTGEELSTELNHILGAFNKLSKYKRFQDSIHGWYRGLEVVHNTETNEYHPHIHLMLAVKKHYFTTHYYIKQAEWTEMWKKALGVDYTPIVDIRRVKGHTARAIAEVAKYSCKPSEILYFEDWKLTEDCVRVLDSALANRRLVAYGGILKEMHKKLNLDDVDEGDLTDIGEGDGEKTTDEDLIFVWHTGYAQYVREQ